MTFMQRVGIDRGNLKCTAVFFFFAILIYDIGYSQQSIFFNSKVAQYYDQNGQEVGVLEFIDVLHETCGLAEMDSAQNNLQIHYVSNINSEEKSKCQKFSFTPDSLTREKLNKSFHKKLIKDLDIIYDTTKVKVVNFWFSSCKVCLQKIPILNEVYDQFSLNEDLEFVSITSDTEDRLRGFLKDTEFNFKHITKAGVFGSINSVKAFPVTLVIDKRNKIRAKIDGRVSLPIYKKLMFDALEIFL